MTERIIRDADLADAAELARIHMSSRVTAMPWLAVVHTDDETVEWMRNVVIPHQRVRVAIEGGESVGLAAFVDGWLEQLYVRPDVRGRGIGSMLFEDVCRHSPGPFQFWVFQRNHSARRFYERRGCRLLKLTDGQTNEEREPDALYEKVVQK